MKDIDKNVKVKKTSTSSTKGKDKLKTNSYKYAVIVESPAKAKTIKKYLGPNYGVLASMGHIRDLPKSKIGIDIENNFEPTYINIKGKAPIINELKKGTKNCEKVFLAADPDREGEAISFHISNILGLDIVEQNRVTFNEITKDAVKYAIKNPRVIDINLFNAQQARRLLDRLVGYKLSPFLWSKVKRGLSAGRVQSVAVKIIVDREEEIRNFVKEEYWTIDAYLFSSDNNKDFKASLYTFKGKKLTISNEDDAKSIYDEIIKNDFYVKSIKKSVKNRRPSPPFITSTLQQDASRKLNFQSKKTMKIAQELYEGVDLKGYGSQGLITYMRTDSFRLSPESINEARKYILSNFDESYIPSSHRVYKSKKNSSVQDAHEAIRPTIVDLHPEKIKADLTNDQYKLYKLIWDRFIACQMSDCLLDTVSVNIEAGVYGFKANGFKVKFKGFTAIYEEAKDTKDDKQKMLPNLKEGEKLNLKKLEKTQNFTQPPSRYTEATLIKTLEENGIGRPSTYSPTISTILTRDYIVRDGKSLMPTELGEVITSLMKSYFSEIVDEEFSANMENSLDMIEDGNKDWKELLNNFYEGFEKTLKSAEEELKDKKVELMPVISDVECEKCGSLMVIKKGRFGEFLACPSYPECKNTKAIIKKSDGECPLCGEDILIKKSKKGKIYFGCSKNPDCSFMTWDTPLKEKCEKCGNTLLKKFGKSGKIYCSNEKCDYKRGLKD